MSDLTENPNRWFSHAKAHTVLLKLSSNMQSKSVGLVTHLLYSHGISGNR